MTLTDKEPTDPAVLEAAIRKELPEVLRSATAIRWLEEEERRACDACACNQTTVRWLLVVLLHRLLDSKQGALDLSPLLADRIDQTFPEEWRDNFRSCLKSIGQSSAADT
jgi:hypothetical protein